MKTLSANDYKKILTYYKIRIPKSNPAIRKRAIKALLQKLCQCTKKLKDKKNKMYGICNNSVMKTKNLTYHRYTCKKNAHFIPKTKRHALIHKLS